MPLFVALLQTEEVFSPVNQLCFGYLGCILKCHHLAFVVTP
jgi:hypothetical protein